MKALYIKMLSFLNWAIVQLLLRADHLDLYAFQEPNHHPLLLLKYSTQGTTWCIYSKPLYLEPSPSYTTSLPGQLPPGPQGHQQSHPRKLPRNLLSHYQPHQLSSALYQSTSLATLLRSMTRASVPKGD